MPATQVVLYRDDDETVPLLTWLDDLQPQVGVANCRVQIELLRSLGYELRRPHADMLEDGITHGFIKHGKQVPAIEIERATRFRARYNADPVGHRFEEG